MNSCSPKEFASGSVSAAYETTRILGFSGGGNADWVGSNVSACAGAVQRRNNSRIADPGNSPGAIFTGDTECSNADCRADSGFGSGSIFGGNAGGGRGR